MHKSSRPRFWYSEVRSSFAPSWPRTFSTLREPGLVGPGRLQRWRPRTTERTSGLSTKRRSPSLLRARGGKRLAPRDSRNAGCAPTDDFGGRARGEGLQRRAGRPSRGSAEFTPSDKPVRTPACRAKLRRCRHPPSDPVVQRPSTSPFQGEDRGFESLQGRQSHPVPGRSSPPRPGDVTTNITSPSEA